jgi:phage-related protein
VKQDRNGVRTAADLERKYDFSSIKKAVQLSEEGINKTNATLDQFIKETTEDLEQLQSQIDGNVTTYYYSGIPTLSNLPASEWPEEEYSNHIGDLYYDKETGYAYRFVLDGETNEYSWLELADSDVAEALALANAAQDTADSKRRVFLTSPIPPYDNGDLWLNNQEIYVCQISKAKDETYTDGDFIIATKYTDDTVATQVANELSVVKGQVTTIREDNNELKIEFTETTNLVNDLTNEVADEIATRTAMIRATSENGLPVIELGSTESPVQTKYKNDGMYIVENGATTSYFKNGKAFNYDMEVINSFTLGRFAFKPRENGNLSLVYIGDGGDE